MISIIIPVLNEEDTIEKTIRQFEALDLPHEVIVSDDGSKDKTAAIAQKYADRVVLRPEGVASTIAANRNRGAKVARGDFLAFVDSSVRIEDVNLFFKTALQDFEHNPSLAALTVGIYTYPELNTWLDSVVYAIMNFNLMLWNNVFHSGMAQGKFQMFRRATFERINGYREDFPVGEDADIFARISKIGRTKIDRRLKIYHPSRRAHTLGWPRLLYLWFLDWIWVQLFDKTRSRDWGRVDKKT